MDGDYKKTEAGRSETKPQQGRKGEGIAASADTRRQTSGVGGRGRGNVL